MKKFLYVMVFLSIILVSPAYAKYYEVGMDNDNVLELVLTPIPFHGNHYYGDELIRKYPKHKWIISSECKDALTFLGFENKNGNKITTQVIFLKDPNTGFFPAYICYGNCVMYDIIDGRPEDDEGLSLFLKQLIKK